MQPDTWEKMVETLKGCQIPFEPGLTDDEVQRVERDFAFRFPPDLRAFLQIALPVGPGFPNWRSEPADSLRDRLSIPLEGVLFDMRFNGFWLDEWGSRPNGPDEAEPIVRRLLAEAPVLIPVWNHRMIPDRPHAPGNPVFSVHQTDIIYYGADLRDYLLHEFTAPGGAPWPTPNNIRRIEFWDIERFLSVRWSRGWAVFDNSRGQLP